MIVVVEVGFRISSRHTHTKCKCHTRTDQPCFSTILVHDNGGWYGILHVIQLVITTITPYHKYNMRTLLCDARTTYKKGVRATLRPAHERERREPTGATNRTRACHYIQAHAVIDSRGGIWTRSVVGLPVQRSVAVQRQTPKTEAPVVTPPVLAGCRRYVSALRSISVDAPSAQPL
jgi:hypothetical protein